MHEATTAKQIFLAPASKTQHHPRIFSSLPFHLPGSATKAIKDNESDYKQVGISFECSLDTSVMKKARTSLLETCNEKRREVSKISLKAEALRLECECFFPPSLS